MSDPTDAELEAFGDDDDEMIPNGIEAAAIGFTEAGLLMPPVPRELADAVEEFDDMLFGTDEVDLTNREDWLRRASDLSTPVGVTFGYVGHGIASHALCYQLILTALAVFVRQPFGSIYSEDIDAERAAFNALVEQLEELVVIIDLAHSKGRIGPGQRLIVIVDGDDSGWRMTTADWHATLTPVKDALNTVRSP